MRKPYGRRGAFVLAFVLACTSASAQTIAKIENVEGVVSIQKKGGRSSLAAIGTELSASDMVSTMKDSTALLVFTDKSQIAMRPQSRMVITSYAYKEAEPQSDSMVVSLVKGGMRTLTGLIGKRGDPDAFKVAAAGATLGVTASDFIARLCDNDCVADQVRQAKVRQAPPSASGSIGKVAALTGTVMATSKGETRRLVLNGAIFAEDVIESKDASTALVVLSDNTQFSLQKNTRVIVTAYRYDQQRADQSTVKIEMTSGASRFSSGAISKMRPENVEYRAFTSTIGIRGTEFGVACTAAGAHEGAAAAQAATAGCDQSVYVHVDEGKIVLRSGNQDREFGKGMTGYIAAPGMPPVRLASTPAFMTPAALSQPQASSQSSTQTDTQVQSPATEREIGAPLSAGTALPQGLFIAANDGQVVLRRDGESVVLNRGESGYVGADSTAPAKLATSPSFLDADPFLAPIKFLDASCFQ